MPQNIQDIILGGAGGGAGAGIKGDWDVASTLTNLSAVASEYPTAGIYNVTTKVLTSPATDTSSNVVEGAFVTFAKTTSVSVEMHDPVVNGFVKALTDNPSTWAMAGYADSALSAAEIRDAVEYGFLRAQNQTPPGTLPAAFRFVGGILLNPMDGSINVFTMTRKISDANDVDFLINTIGLISNTDPDDIFSFLYRKINTSDVSFAGSGMQDPPPGTDMLYVVGAWSKTNNASFENLSGDALAVGSNIDGAYLPTILRPFYSVFSIMGGHQANSFTMKCGPDKVLGKLFVPPALLQQMPQTTIDVIMPNPYIHLGDLNLPVFPGGTLVNDMYRAIGGGVAYNVYATEGDILLVDNIDSGTESVRIAIPINQTTPTVTVDSTGVTNASNVSGQTVTDALNNLGSDVQNANSNASNAASQVGQVNSDLAYFKQAQDIYTIQGMSSGYTFGRYIISTMTSPGATIQYYAPVGCVIEIFNTTGSPYTLGMNTGNTGQTLVGGGSYNIPANSYVRLIMDASNNWVAI